MIGSFFLFDIPLRATFAGWFSPHSSCFPLRGSHIKPQCGTKASPSVSICHLLTPAVVRTVPLGVIRKAKTGEPTGPTHFSRCQTRLDPAVATKNPDEPQPRAAKGLQLSASHGKNHIFWGTVASCLLRADCIFCLYIVSGPFLDVLWFHQAGCAVHPEPPTPGVETQPRVRLQWGLPWFRSSTSNHTLLLPKGQGETPKAEITGWDKNNFLETTR